MVERDEGKYLACKKGLDPSDEISGFHRKQRRGRSDRRGLVRRKGPPAGLM